MPGVKLFFAGAEGDEFCSLLNESKVRYRLLSYYYLRKKSKKRIEEILYNTTPKDSVLFMDSGAFTLMTSRQADYAKDPKMFWDEIEHYAEEYCQFLAEHKGRLFCAAELDLDNVLVEDHIVEAVPEKWKTSLWEWHETNYDMLSEQQYVPPPVLGWRGMIESTGVPTVNVWHTIRTPQGWDAQLRSSVYNGLPSEVAEMSGMNRWVPYLTKARMSGRFVHAFGMTQAQPVRRLSLYSCDSTSWMVRGRYGETVVFKNGRLTHYDNTKKDIRKRFKLLYEKNGLNWAAIERDEPRAINQINLLAWLQLAEYIWKSPNKDYWKTEMDGKPVGTYGPPRGEELDLTAVPVEDLEVVEGDEEDPPEKNKLRILNPKMSLEEFSSTAIRCDNCYLADRCQYMEAGSECHFKFDVSLTTDEGVQKALKKMAEMQYQRAMFSLLLERMDGGMIDKNASQEMRTFVEMVTNQIGTGDPNAAQPDVPKGPSVLERLLTRALMPENEQKTPKKAPKKAVK